MSLWDKAECAFWGGHTWEWFEAYRHCTVCDKIQRLK